MVDLELKPAKLNGTLFPPKHPGIGRQMPNPAADEVWEEWELTRFIPVTSDQVRAMGKDPSTVAKLEDEDWGLGDDAYVAIFDVFHQIHCLNTLRRMVYGKYYNETGGRFHHKTLKGEMHEVHINHCVDMVLQTLQCSGNVNLVTMHWVKEQEYPFPDMSINKQCINFDKLTEWRKENTIDVEKYGRVMKKKEGKVKELPAADQFYRYYKPDVTNPNHLNGANPDEDFNL
ncbi:hypothetical protein GQ53DRAFT_744994 [Thozetella sp. PMI_491]|nr:hypothetical protein GQ53DRAFT_744994 [Thozetella sp. PMI_491]